MVAVVPRQRRQGVKKTDKGIRALDFGAQSSMNISF
jgi:hypothetical protein